MEREICVLLTRYMQSVTLLKVPYNLEKATSWKEKTILWKKKLKHNQTYTGDWKQYYSILGAWISPLIKS